MKMKNVNNNNKKISFSIMKTLETRGAYFNDLQIKNRNRNKKMRRNKYLNRSNNIVIEKY